MKNIYNELSNDTDIFDSVFESVYRDISVIYRDTSINEDRSVITIVLSDPSTSESVKQHARSVIDNQLSTYTLNRKKSKNHKINLSWLLFKVVTMNGNIIQIIKRY